MSEDIKIVVDSESKKIVYEVMYFKETQNQWRLLNKLLTDEQINSSMGYYKKSGRYFIVDK